MSQQEQPLPPPLPLVGRLAGIDFGTVRIGISVCDPSRILASPFEIYSRKSIDADAAYFQQLAHTESLVGWVIGLPVHINGTESEKSLEAKAFGNWLAELTELPIAFVDERLTSKEARNMLADDPSFKKRRRKSKQGKQLDAVAAQIILTSYLEGSWHTGSERALDD